MERQVLRELPAAVELLVLLGQVERPVLLDLREHLAAVDHLEQVELLVLLAQAEQAVSTELPELREQQDLQVHLGQVELLEHQFQLPQEEQIGF